MEKTITSPDGEKTLTISIKDTTNNNLEKILSIIETIPSKYYDLLTLYLKDIDSEERQLKLIEALGEISNLPSEYKEKADKYLEKNFFSTEVLSWIKALQEIDNMEEDIKQKIYQYINDGYNPIAALRLFNDNSLNN